jgi:hypothetical protein
MAVPPVLMSKENSSPLIRWNLRTLAKFDELARRALSWLGGKAARTASDGMIRVYGTVKAR